MFLSVIIPVYQVEAYLPKCIESIIHQNLSDLEVILVDDGSTDGSWQICDDYASRYAYIRVVHQPNGGLSAARNAGMNLAQGDYVMFMDSDDWWNEKVSVSQMLLEVKENPSVEMFLFSSLDYFVGQGLLERKEHEHRIIQTKTVADYYESLLRNGNLEVAAYTKILKKSFLLQHDLYFQKGIVSEDNEWMLRLLRVLKSVHFLPYSLYIYRANREGSITKNIGEKNLQDILSIVQKSITYHQTHQHPLRNAEWCYCAYLWFCALGLQMKLSATQRGELKKQFLATAMVCEYSKSPKTKMCYQVYRIFGHDLTAFLLGTYIKLKNQYTLGKKVVKTAA